MAKRKKKNIDGTVKQGKAGRKTRLTKKLIAEASHLIEQGNYTKTICAYLGLSQNTWYKWMREGKRQDSGVAHDFYKAIIKAESMAEMRNVDVIQQASVDTWTASAWYLERKFPDRWGRKEQIKSDVNHSGDVGIEHRFAQMTDEELENISKRFDLDD